MDRTHVTRFVVVLVALLTVTGAAVPMAAATTTPPTPPQRVYGTVTDSGQTVAGANVTISHGDTVVEHELTGEDGTYDVEVSADGLESGDELTVSVEGTDASETIQFEPSGAENVDIAVDSNIVASATADVDSDAAASVDLGADQSVTGGDFQFADGTTGTVTVNLLAGAPAEAGQLTEGPVAAYLDVSLDESLSGTTNVEFTVSKAALDSSDIDVQNASIAHYTDGAWQHVETTVVSETTDSVTLGADVTSLGSFAISKSVTDSPQSQSAELDADGDATVTLGTSQIENVAFDLGSGTTGTVTVMQTSGPSGGASTPADVSVAAYLDLDAPEGASGNVTVTITQSALDDAGLSAEDAKILHYTDDSWQTLETTVVGESGSNVMLRAPVDGFSPFAVAGSSDAGDGGEDTTTSTTTSSSGGGGASTTTTSETTTSDDSSSGGSSSGGSSSDETTTPATTTTTETIATTDTTTTTDTITTTDTATTTEETTTTTEETTDDTTDAPGDDGESGGPIPGFGMGIALVAILGAALLALRE